MRYQPIKKTFFIKKRENLIKKLLPDSIAVIMSNDELNRNGDQNFPYRQSSDLFYLTGIEQEKCILTLCPHHPDEKLREIIFTIQPNESLETWTGHKLTKEEVKKISGVKTVKWLDEFDSVFRDLVLNSENIYINLNEYVKYESDVVCIKKIVLQRNLKKNTRHIVLKD